MVTTSVQAVVGTETSSSGLPNTSLCTSRGSNSACRLVTGYLSIWLQRFHSSRPRRSMHSGCGPFPRCSNQCTYRPSTLLGLIACGRAPGVTRSSSWKELLKRLKPFLDICQNLILRLPGLTKIVLIYAASRLTLVHLRLCPDPDHLRAESRWSHEVNPIGSGMGLLWQSRCLLHAGQGTGRRVAHSAGLFVEELGLRAESLRPETLALVVGPHSVAAVPQLHGRNHERSGVPSRRVVVLD